MANELDAAIDSAARLIVESTYVIALVGAGLSVESGVPTFRGAGGLWTRVGEPTMNGFEDFVADPKAWWDDQQKLQNDPARAEFRDAIERAKPNPGHYALVELELMGVLKNIITQNVDNLHFEAGSTLVTEIHGNRTKMRCINCEGRWHRDEFQLEEYPIRCPDCSGLVKGDTVMFGEPIPPSVLETCFEETDRSDCIITIGTSATVYPAASFPESIKQRGGFVIEANPSSTPLSALSDVVMRGPTGETLPRMVDRVKKMKGA